MPSNTFLRLALALTIAVGASASVSAQRSVTFIEGLGSPASVWDGYRADLRNEFEINDFVAPWDQAGRTGIPDIANGLYGAVASNSVVVSHSTGGAIAREMIRTRGTGRVSKLITLGTPHLGAPIATLAAENTGQLLNFWAGDLAYPWALLIGGQGAQATVQNILNDLVDPAIDFAVNRSGLLDGVVQRDLTPGSSFLSTLNANPSATLPASGAYAIYGDEDWMTHFRIIESAAEGDGIEEGDYVRYALYVRNGYIGIGAFVFAYASYLEYLYQQTGDIGYQLSAAYYANAAFAFWWSAYAINTVWQYDWSLSLLGNNQFGDQVGADDGFLPNGTQAPSFYGSAHRLRAIGANHVEETAGPAALARIRQAFNAADIDVPERGGGGTPPPDDPPHTPCKDPQQIMCEPY